MDARAYGITLLDAATGQLYEARGGPAETAGLGGTLRRGPRSDLTDHPLEFGEVERLGHGRHA